MKNHLLIAAILAIFLSITFQLSAQVGINTDGSQPDPSAGLDVKFNNKGFLPPRMTTEQMNAIINPASGLVVYCTDCGSGAMAMFINETWYIINTKCLLSPITPVSGTHVPSSNQIVWNWNPVSTATGYKWNTTNNYNTSIDLGTSTTMTEADLICNNSYIRYVWSYNVCGTSTPLTLIQSTSFTPPSFPTAGTHVPSATQIVWNWNPVFGATGYKWNIVNDYGSATEMGTATTKKETNLSCNSTYERYVWAYSDCGVSSSTLLSSTTLLNPSNPTASVHIPSPTQIVWNWNTISDATGYKWCTLNSYAAATDLGTSTTKAETGLSCNTSYSSYVWSYTECGVSTATLMSQTTSMDPPTAPISGTHVASKNQIVWNWNPLAGAMGYKWNTINDFASATDMLTNTTKTETGLYPNSTYTRFVWAYNTCGVSTETVLTQTLPFLLGQSYGGGIIFYVDGTGQHGLIAPTSDQSTGAQWGCYETLVDHTSTAIGTGQANTSTIVYRCGTAGIAARICDDLVLNGYSDWFLPSRDELNQMYLQKTLIGGFANNYYWSSSEYSADYAWFQEFGSGSQNYNDKYYTLYVRAVRAF